MSLIRDAFLFHRPAASLELAATAAAGQGTGCLGEERDLFPSIIPFDWTTALCVRIAYSKINKQAGPILSSDVVELCRGGGT